MGDDKRARDAHNGPTFPKNAPFDVSPDGPTKKQPRVPRELVQDAAYQPAATELFSPGTDTGKAPQPVSLPPDRVRMADPPKTDVVALFRADEVTSDERPAVVDDSPFRAPTELLATFDSGAQPRAPDPFNGAVMTQADMPPLASIPAPPSDPPPEAREVPPTAAWSLPPLGDVVDEAPVRPAAREGRRRAASASAISEVERADVPLTPERRAQGRSPVVVLLLVLGAAVGGVVVATAVVVATGLVDPRTRYAALFGDGAAATPAPGAPSNPGAKLAIIEKQPEAPTAPAGDVAGDAPSTTGATTTGAATTGTATTAATSTAGAATPPDATTGATATTADAAPPKGAAGGNDAAGDGPAGRAGRVAVAGVDDKSKSGVAGAERALGDGARRGLGAAAAKKGGAPQSATFVLRKLTTKQRGKSLIVEAKCDALVVRGAKRALSAAMKATATVAAEGRFDKKALILDAVARCGEDLGAQISASGRSADQPARRRRR